MEATAIQQCLSCKAIAEPLQANGAAEAVSEAGGEPVPFLDKGVAGGGQRVDVQAFVLSLHLRRLLPLSELGPYLPALCLILHLQSVKPFASVTIPKFSSMIVLSLCVNQPSELRLLVFPSACFDPSACCVDVDEAGGLVLLNDCPLIKYAGCA